MDSMEYGLIRVANMTIGQSDYPYLTSNWIVGGFGIILRADGLPFFHSYLNAYQSNRSSNPYAASGQYLASLESLLSTPEIKLEMPTRISAVDLWQCVLGETIKTFRSSSPILSTDQVLELISRASKNSARLGRDDAALTRFAVRAVARIRKLFARSLIQELYATRHRIHRSIPRFCGLSWSRRLWFLLHGAHPPKTECRLAFGCA